MNEVNENLINSEDREFAFLLIFPLVLIGICILLYTGYFTFLLMAETIRGNGFTSEEFFDLGHFVFAALGFGWISLFYTLLLLIGIKKIMNVDKKMGNEVNEP